jgi:hypothetical protein
LNIGKGGKMSIKNIELFHGAVLTKLMRNHHPVALRMIETRPKEGFFYIINDEVDFYIKHRMGKEGKKGPISWQFSFNPDEIQKMAEVRKKRNNGFYVALVCALPGKSKSKMQIALFDPLKKDVGLVLDFNSNSTQTFTIKDNLSGGMLVVIKDRKEICKLSKGALDKWDVPGR